MKDILVTLGMMKTLEPSSEMWTSKVLSNQVNKGIIVHLEAQSIYDVYGI
jgi:hypothetical protein